MDKKFSVCEIAEISIQIEKNGKTYYEEAAERVSPREVSEMFRLLSSEEEKHIGTFTELFNRSCEYNPEGAYTEEYFAYMNALAGEHVFTARDKGKKAAEKINTSEEAVSLGIKFEKDSILFYEGLKDLLSEEEKEVVSRIIEEEKKHLKMLFGLKKEQKQ